MSKVGQLISDQRNQKPQAKRGQKSANQSTAQENHPKQEQEETKSSFRDLDTLQHLI